MLRTKPRLFVVFLAALTLFYSGCKKNPIAATLSPGQQTIAIICSPASAGPGAVITVAVVIAGNSDEIRVFGLDAAYDSEMFEFESADRGSLSTTWATVDGNEIASGSLKLGGYVGGGSPIPANSSGPVGVFRLRVTGAQYGNGQQTQIWIRQYTDDISGFTPEPASAVFTLKK